MMNEFFNELQRRIDMYNKVYPDVFRMYCAGEVSDEYINQVNPLRDVELELQKPVCEGKYRIECFIEERFLAIEFQEDKERQDEINQWFLDNATEDIDGINFIIVDKDNEDYYLELIMTYLTACI